MTRYDQTWACRILAITSGKPGTQSSGKQGDNPIVKEALQLGNLLCLKIGIYTFYEPTQKLQIYLSLAMFWVKIVSFVRHLEGTCADLWPQAPASHWVLKSWQDAGNNLKRSRRTCTHLFILAISRGQDGKVSFLYLCPSWKHMPSCTYLYSLHSGRWDHHSSAPIFLVLWGWKLLLCLGSEMHS